MDFQKLIQSRFSSRLFSDQKIDESGINNILHDVRIAPTRKNHPPQSILVIHTKEGLEKVDKVTPCRFGAPLVFAMLGDKNDECILRDGRGILETDVAIISTYLLLSAENQGLGTCWVCWFEHETFKKEFELPDNLVPYNFIMAGYKTPETKRYEKYATRKEISEFVKFM